MTQTTDFASNLFVDFQKSSSKMNSDDPSADEGGRKDRPSATRKLETRRAIEDYMELKRLHTSTDDYAFDFDE
ncbi:MAG: hypothetical protein CME36_10465 [unclassified Hahellaceae]|nr:hypothetical protein [Hahellaceae bacterium]|tara:strand:+ start:25304 stop:25522 length:219 start_codon:yes stop_codon:yes gene_type:complete